MTYEPRYSIKAAGTHNADGLTLYEARKALIVAQADGAALDATHISRAGRCVGFYCEWTGTVRPMFQAYDAERTNLQDWA